MFYVSAVKKEMGGYSVNKKGGCTVSVLKRGGVKAAWIDAKTIAGWSP